MTRLLPSAYLTSVCCAALTGVAALAPASAQTEDLPDILMSERIAPGTQPNFVRFFIQEAFEEAAPGQRVVLDGPGRTYVIDNELIPSSGDHLHIEAGSPCRPTRPATCSRGPSATAPWSP